MTTADELRPLGIDTETVALLVIGHLHGMALVREHGGDSGASEFERSMRSSGGPLGAAQCMARGQVNAVRTPIGRTLALAAVDNTDNLSAEHFSILLPEHPDPRQLIVARDLKVSLLDAVRVQRIRQSGMPRLQHQMLRQFAERPELFMRVVELQARVSSSGLESYLEP